MSAPLQIEGFAVGPLQSNAYVVCRDDGAAVAVDPGHPDPRLPRQIEAWGRGLGAILLTHAHLDHVGGVAHLHRRYGAPVYLHPADRPLYDRTSEQAESFGLRVEQPPEPDHELTGGRTLELHGLVLDVRHVPGHSPGHVLFRTEDVAFVGDCVFAGSVGRTDLPGGDAAALMTSIREQILTLPGGTTLYPGHGPPTTVAREAESNPFLTGAYGWSG